jgi:hypothetical protein
MAMTEDELFDMQQDYKILCVIKGHHSDISEY